MNESTRNSFWKSREPGTGPGRRAELHLTGLCFVWAFCLTFTRAVIEGGVLPATGPIRWAVAALPSVIAVFLLVRYARFLREADELQRVIQLQALALGCGGGFFIVAGNLQLEALGAPTLDRVYVLLAMALLYGVGVTVAERRYR